MLKRALLGALGALALTTAAHAQAVPSTFPGLMYNLSPLALTNCTDGGTGNQSPATPPPMALHHVRIFDFYCGFGTNAAPFFMSQWNPSAGTYLYTKMDPVIAFWKARNVQVELTAEQYPTYISGSATNISGSAQIAQVQTALGNMLSHYVTLGTPIDRYGIQNEPGYGSTYWTGTMADLALLHCGLSTTISSTSPTTKIVEAGWTTINNAGTPAAPRPRSYFYSLDQYLQGVAACNGKIDALDFHNYPDSPSGPLIPSDGTRAPELYVTALNNFKAVHAANGFPTTSIESSEGRAAADTVNSDTDGWAALNAVHVLATQSTGVSWYNHMSMSWRTSTYVAQAQDGATDMSYAPDRLNKSGRAVKQMFSWLAGGTWTTPLARVTGTNLVRTLPTAANSASFPVGKISGPASPPAGCPANVSSTVVSLPATWGVFDAHAAAGSAVYSRGIVTNSWGETVLRLVFCGTDSTASTGTNTIQIKVDGNITTGVTNSQAGIIGAQFSLAAGSMANIDAVQLYAEDNAFNAGFIQSIYPVARPAAEQYREFRFQTLSSGTTAVHHLITVNPYYNNGTLPYYMELDIAAPDLELGSAVNVWSGVLRGADGVSRCVAWVAGAVNIGTNYTLPSACSGYTHFWDWQGRDNTFTGTPTLTNGPYMFAPAAPKYRIGQNDNDPLFQAAFNG